MPVSTLTKFLVFQEVPSDRKTSVWRITSLRRGALLGTIKWYGPWRQYTFWPEPHTTFNRSCLADINVFIDKLMAERRREKAGAR
jgi:hypothetical protein